MSILINKDTKVITQGITGKTGQFHTRMCRDYANGKAAFVAGVQQGATLGCREAGRHLVVESLQQGGALREVTLTPPMGALLPGAAVRIASIGSPAS